MDKWIIPCSVKYFDVTQHFSNHDNVVWKRSSAIKTGDVVYIYVGKPYSEIKYRCRVINENVDDETLKNNEYAITSSGLERYKYIQMELEESYPDGMLGFYDLKEHGLSQVQKQARVYKELAEYIESKEAEKAERG